MGEIDFLVEWAVWGTLDSVTDLELILLKGHLLLETVLTMILSRNNITSLENFSFYRKINELEKINFEDTLKKEIIIVSLRKVNMLRNQLAHELHFNVNDGDFELWSKNILENLKGIKYSKFTQRTKIVHAFSILAINIVELNKSIK